MPINELRRHEYYKLLERWKEGGQVSCTDVFEAAPFLQTSFPELFKEEAVQLIKDWMEISHPKR
jgi:hypothetical protein